MLLLRERNLVCITLYLLKLVKSDMIDTLEREEFEDTTTRLYTYMTRKPLFPKLGPVFMRRVYSVTNSTTTETLNVPTVASVQNVITMSNVSEVPQTLNLSSETSSTLTTPIIYSPSTIKDIVSPSPTFSSTNSEIPISVTPLAIEENQYHEKLLNEILGHRLPEPNPGVMFGTTAVNYGTTSVTYGTSTIPYDSPAVSSLSPEILRVRGPDPSAVTYDTITVTYGTNSVPFVSPAITYDSPAVTYGSPVITYGTTAAPSYPFPQILRVREPDPSAVKYGTTTVTYGTDAVPFGSPAITYDSPFVTYGSPVVTYGTTAAPLYPFPQILRVRRPDPSENDGTGYQDIGTDPFSLFLRKLLQVLSSKTLADLQKLIKPFETYVTTLVDSGKLMKLGSTISSYIAQQTPLLRLSTDEIRRQFFISQISLEYRRKMLTADVNTMLDDLDDVYDANEEEAMQRVLREVTTFPNTDKNGEQIVKGFVDDVFLYPMHRIAGTMRGKLIFDNIAKIANTYNLPYDFARRFEDNKYEANKETNSDHAYFNRESTVKYSERNELTERSFDRQDTYHKKINTDKKFIIPISINKNLNGYSRRHRNEMIDKKTEYEDEYGDSESGILNNADGGIEIKIDIKNGRYSTAKTINLHYNKRKKNIEINKGSRELDKKDGGYPTAKTVKSKHNNKRKEYIENNKRPRDLGTKEVTSRTQLEPIVNNAVAYKRSLSKKFRIPTFHEDKRHKFGINQAKSGDINKNKFSVSRKKPASTTTNKDSLFFDYTDTKLNKKYESLETKKNIDFKIKTGRRRTNEKTKIEYDCKPLPVVNVDEDGTRNINNKVYSELLIFCDRASTVGSME